MPFPMKILPIDDSEGMIGTDHPKPVAKSRLKRFFERRQSLSSVPRISSAEKLSGTGEPEPSSVILDKMVQSFMEDTNEKSSSRCVRNRCNCFHGNCDDISDDDLDFAAAAGDPQIGFAADAADALKSLILCSSVVERNLLADVSNIVEKIKISKGKEESRRIVTVGLRSLGYDASICKSHWEKSPSFPAGEYEYVDVIAEGERLLVEVDFRSEFEIARSTKSYRAVLQSLPSIFVGKEDRLRQIVAVVSEAVRQSLKKKGLHFPPWRKPEYMKAKWLGPYEREKVESGSTPAVDFSGKVEIRRGDSGEAEARMTWQLPAVKPKETQRGEKVVTGLASVFREKT